MRGKALMIVCAAAVGTASPAVAALPYTWSFCSGTSFNVCLDYTLVDMGSNNYQITFQYTSTTAASGEEGVLTGAGLYRSKQAPNLNVTDATIVAVDPLWAQWSINTNGLSGGGAIEIEVSGSSNQGATNGLPVGGFVTIGFSSTNLSSYNLANLYARGHIQSFGPNDCSLKPDSNLGVVGGTAEANAECGTKTTITQTTPEPITMVLVGSGLVGMGVARRRHRNGAVRDA